MILINQIIIKHKPCFVGDVRIMIIIISMKISIFNIDSCIADTKLCILIIEIHHVIQKCDLIKILHA